MATGPYYLKQCSGPECTECCAVYKECDCVCLSVIMDYVEYVKNKVACRSDEGVFGISASDVTKAGMLLVGFASMGTYWRPEFDFNDGNGKNVYNTFGRSLVVADINYWGVPGSDWRGWFSYILKNLDVDKFNAFEIECGCDPKDWACLVKIFETMRTYLEIGNTGQPPYTLEEWEKQLCGTCYPNCTYDNGAEIVNPE